MSKAIFSFEYIRLREILLNARDSKNITQAELARLLNKPQSYISKYENGEKMLNVIEFINVCNALEIEAEKIIQELRTLKNV
jgi:transcriptional regulator with XRE-family HTH domain